MSDSRTNLSPVEALLDACGAVIQEAKHHIAGKGLPLPEGLLPKNLPAALVDKLIALEKLSNSAPILRLTRSKPQHGPEDVKAVAEICIDRTGKVLWVERWILNGIHPPGDGFIRDYKEYRVVDSKITFGELGGALVEHVVEMIADRTPRTIEEMVQTT